MFRWSWELWDLPLSSGPSVEKRDVSELARELVADMVVARVIFAVRDAPERMLYDDLHAEDQSGRLPSRPGWLLAY